METKRGEKMSDVHRQTVLDCKNTFSTIHGSRFLDHLKTFCGGHVNQENFVAESATKTAYNLGMNRVYRHILSMIECDVSALNNSPDCIIENEIESGE